MLVGALQERLSKLFVTLTVGLPGALGVVAGVTATTPVGAPGPAAFMAATRNEYVVPFVKFEIVAV